jgi:hypothetical protein
LSSISGVAGHSFTAIIQRKRTNFSDNSYEVTAWKPYKSYGVWGDIFGFSASPGKKGIRNNDPIEAVHVQNILNGNVNGVWGIRKANINETQIPLIEALVGQAGCNSDNYGIPGFGDLCNCSSFSTRMWYLFTNKSEDFRAFGLFGRSPSDTKSYIIEKNGITKSQFIN